MIKITDVVKNLLILNILVFIAGLVFNTDMLALRYPGSEEFEPYQLITYFFMHANLAHIFFNMFALVMFGSAVELLLGPKRFLFFYFFCALGAAAFHTLYNYYDFTHMQHLIDAFRAHPNYETYWAFYKDVPMKTLHPDYVKLVNQLGDQVRTPSADVVSGGLNLMDGLLQAKMNTPTVGASGAIYGLLLAFGMFFPNVELMLIFLPIPIKAKYFIPFLMLAELFLGVNQFSWDNIAHFAHLGGALSGFLLILYWRHQSSLRS
jgi:membrane associated rhomboid family serine protease